MTYSNKTLGSRTIGYLIIPSENSRSILYLYIYYYTIILYTRNMIQLPGRKIYYTILLLLLMANIIILYAQW